MRSIEYVFNMFTTTGQFYTMSPWWPAFLAMLFQFLEEGMLRPVKPCPGVPGIHLNADRTVSMTAALLCGAGASPVHKDRGGSADHDQSENNAHAQRHAWEMLLWLKNGAHGRRARLA